MSLRRWPFSLERLAARRFSSLLLARFSSSSDVSCCCQHTDSTGSQHIPSHMLQSTDRTGSLRTPPYTSINRLHWLSADSLISHFSAQTTLALSVYQSIKRPHWLSVYLLMHFNQPAPLAFSVSPHTFHSTCHTGGSPRNTNTGSTTCVFFSWGGTDQLVERQGATGIAPLNFVVPNNNKKKKRKKQTQY